MTLTFVQLPMPRRPYRGASTLYPDRLIYQCPDVCWDAHLAEWKFRQRNGGNLPEPFPFNHLAFN